MSSLPVLKFRATDNNGAPISGAKLYFYITGTTTYKNTYSDEDLTAANANPVVADANGWFGEIYMIKSEEYTVKLTDASDNTIWTVNNINAVRLTTSTIETRLKQAASNPLDYGALGDGVADEASYVQSAITNATYCVDLLGKTYRCDSNITLKSNMKLVNGTLDFTLGTGHIVGAGTIGSSIGTVGTQNTQLTNYIATTATVTQDDLLYISGTTLWQGSTFTGELFSVSSSSYAAAGITANEPIFGLYPATSPIYKITPVRNVKFENLTVKVLRSVDWSAISLEYCRDVLFDNVRIIVDTATLATACTVTCISLDTCYNVKINNCLLEGALESATTAAIDAVMVGVDVNKASRNVFINCCDVINLRQGIWVGRAGRTIANLAGVCANVVIDDCDVLANCDKGKPVHFDYFTTDTYLNNSRVSAYSGAAAGSEAWGCVTCYGVNTNITNNVIKCDGSVDNGISIIPFHIESTVLLYVNCKNNTIHAPTTASNNGIMCGIGSSSETKVNISENQILDAPLIGINFGTGIGEVLIGDNYVYAATGIKCAASSTYSGLTIQGNSIKSSTNTINISGKTTEVHIVGNLCKLTNDDAGNIIIAGTAGTDISNIIIANNIIKNGTYGITLTNHSNALEINNNFVSLATGNISGAIINPIVLYGTGSTPAVTATGGATGNAGTFTGGATSGYGGSFAAGSAVSAPLHLVPQASAPTTGAVGNMYLDTAGVLYSCTVAGTPGTWVKVGTQT